METKRHSDQLDSIFKRVALRCSFSLRKLLSHCWHWSKIQRRILPGRTRFNGIAWWWNEDAPCIGGNEIRSPPQIRRLQTIISDRLSISHGLTSPSLLRTYKSRPIDAAETSMHECNGTYRPRSNGVVHDTTSNATGGRLVSFFLSFFLSSNGNRGTENRNKVLNKWRDIRGDLLPIWLPIFFSRKNCEILRV